MSFSIIDTHSHLHFDAYSDRDEILQKMKDLSCATIVIGTNGATSKTAVELADKEELVYAAVGFHPNFFTSKFVPEEENEDTEEYSTERLKELATSSNRVVALGETGLDYYRMDEELYPIEKGKEIQKRAFIDHLDLGNELSLPIVVHCREAFDDLIEILRERKGKGMNDRCVIHCYTGDWELAEKLLDLGCMLSFTGIVTFPPKKSEDAEKSTLRVIERMPIDKMMIETDAPWLAPIPHRGERNDPTMVRFVAEKIAELRGIDVNEVTRQTTENARGFFQI